MTFNLYHIFLCFFNCLKIYFAIYLGFTGGKIHTVERFTMMLKSPKLAKKNPVCVKYDTLGVKELNKVTTKKAM